MNKKHLLIVILLALALFLIAAIAGKPFVDRSACVGCKDCVRACPTAAVSMEDGRAIIDPELCIDCKICVKTCPYRAIKVPRP